MILAIGTIIGAYVLLQSIALATRPNITESNLTRVSAWLCALVTVGFLIYLWGSAYAFGEAMKPLLK